MYVTRSTEPEPRSQDLISLDLPAGTWELNGLVVVHNDRTGSQTAQCRFSREGFVADVDAFTSAAVAPGTKATYDLLGGAVTLAQAQKVRIRCGYAVFSGGMDAERSVLVAREVAAFHKQP